MLTDNRERIFDDESTISDSPEPHNTTTPQDYSTTHGKHGRTAPGQAPASGCRPDGPSRRRPDRRARLDGAWTGRPGAVPARWRPSRACARAVRTAPRPGAGLRTEREEEGREGGGVSWVT